MFGPACGFILGSVCTKVYVDAAFIDTSEYESHDHCSNPNGKDLCHPLKPLWLTAAKLDITPDDPRWIGAWWGGFLLCGALLFLSALFMFGFPQALDEQQLDAGGESEQAMLPPSLSLEYPGSKPKGSVHGFDINSGLSVCEHLRGEKEQC